MANALGTPANAMRPSYPPIDLIRSVNAANSDPVLITVNLTDLAPVQFQFQANPQQPFRLIGNQDVAKSISRTRVFSFAPEVLAQPSTLQKTLEIGPNGSNLPSVLTTLQDQSPERFEALNKDIAQWLPEFDRILMDTPQVNSRAFMLRTRIGKHPLRASSLSQGSLLALALLTLSHIPEPPTLIGIEDPDRGMHPRLLRDLLDAIHRLSHPEEFGDDRAAVQVVLTTHSPYLLDLFRDRLEDVVVVEKVGLNSTLKRLSTIPHVEEIIRDAHLGEVWFNGILGGVPVGT